MRAVRHLLSPLLAALLVATVTFWVPEPPAAHAAGPDLTVVTDATYTVKPDEAKVAVGVEILARNHRADTATRRFYFDRAFFAVMPGTTGFRISGDGKPKVTVSKTTATYTMLRIDFGQRLYGGKSFRFKLAFDLQDPGGAPAREVRIGSSLVSFPVWAFAGEGSTGSSVAVAFPPGYDVNVEAGALPDRDEAEDGTVIYRSGKIAEPLQFFAYVVADRAGDYAEQERSVAVGDGSASLLLRGWDDDPEWTERVGDLFEQALPALHEEIGLPWPHPDPLVIQEVLNRSAGGYAGLFDPGEGRVEVAYWAPSLVVLHEAAHGWFNGGLLADRWANEGFATIYAGRVAERLGIEGDAPELTDTVLEARIPLNAWGLSGETDDAVEAYGFAASATLAAAVAERAGDEAMRDVWSWAEAGVTAYPWPLRDDGDAPTALGDPSAGAPDWRGLLDLLEERTGTSFDDLWREWVVRPDEVALLEARTSARREYERTIRLADDWVLPEGIRSALRAWQFDAASALMADARTVIAQREALVSRASRAGLDVPGTVREQFESGAFGEASATAADAYSTVGAIVQAEREMPANPDPLMSLGLLGSNPEDDLVTAREAFSAGDLDGALAAAERAQGGPTAAWHEGRRRALFILALVVAVMVLVSGIAGLLRRRWRLEQAGAAAVPGGDRAGPRDPAGDPLDPGHGHPDPVQSDPQPARPADERAPGDHPPGGGPLSAP
jgi:hypothetical protein